MKTLFSALTLLTLFLFCSCRKHPEFKVCFTVDNPVMTLGDTVKINICINNRSSYNWDMGDGTTYTTNYTDTPKHIYLAKGTYTIQMTQSEHHTAITFHKRRVAETQQTVTIQ